MNKFLTRLKSAIASLGLKGKEFSAEEQASIREAYEKVNGNDSFTADFKEYENERKKAEDDAKRLQAQDNIFKAIADALDISGEAGAPNTGEQILAAVESMRDNFEKMSRQAQPDAPAAQKEVHISNHGAHTKEYAFGIQNPFFSTSKRYNAIAVNPSLRYESTPTSADKEELISDTMNFADSLAQRMKSHIAAGTLAGISDKMDYTALTNDPDLGQRYLQVRQDALIAHIVKLPSLEGLFDTISNVQSGMVMTEALFGEMSQAYQEGHVFKGDIAFVPEKAIVDDAMIKVPFGNMKAIETSYLNYLNRSGSDPIKWNLIEWMILKIAEKVNSERIRRNVMGYYVKPKKGQAGHTMFASTGIFHRLVQLYEEHKVLPFFGPDYVYTRQDIGDVLELFAESIANAREDFANFVIYANAAHRPWFSKWCQEKFGKDTNYNGVESKVPNYDIPIRWVPAMGNLPFLFASLDKNIILLQNVPGEENKVTLQKDLEEVIAAAYWKEGAGVAYSGEKMKNRAELVARGAEDQIIFMNWPVVALGKDDKTPDAKKGSMFSTVENSGVNALTDILNAKEGVIYRIELGSATHPTSIAKSGKFSDIASAWEPSEVGEWIKVYFDKEANKFIEVARG